MIYLSLRSREFPTEVCSCYRGHGYVMAKADVMCVFLVTGRRRVEESEADELEARK